MHLLCQWCSKEAKTKSLYCDTCLNYLRKSLSQISESFERIRTDMHFMIGNPKNNVDADIKKYIDKINIVMGFLEEHAEEWDALKLKNFIKEATVFGERLVKAFENIADSLKKPKTED